MTSHKQTILRVSASQGSVNADADQTVFSISAKHTGDGIIQGVGDITEIFYLLMESGDYLLKESGDRIKLDA